MKNEIIKNETKNELVYYGNLNASIPAKKLGEPVLYFRSCEDVLMTGKKVNPFVTVVTDSINMHNIFRSSDEDRRSAISDIFSSCAQYMSNSIMMNAVSILEDPYDNSLVHRLKRHISKEPMYGKSFYDDYSYFINLTTNLVCDKLMDKLYQYYFISKNESIDVNNSEKFIPFMTSMLEDIAKIYTFEGQRFITNMITNGAIDIIGLNNELINEIYKYERETGDSNCYETSNHMVNDSGSYLLFFNMTLAVTVEKIKEVSEAIIYSGIYYLKEFTNNARLDN